MQNGDTGSYNYWDDSYAGSGDNTVDRSYLSGGTGDLTDGIIATENWNLVESPVGPHGPYVGWYTFRGIPSIDFHFGQNVVINSITLYVDDSNGYGGVFVPSGVNIGSTSYSFTDPVGSEPTALTISGLDLMVSDLSMDIFGGTANRNNTWVFISEITFDGRILSVAEPSTILLLSLGLLGVFRVRKQLNG
ncbi:MAG: PEP-CTERM sorting domain-containing protein [Gammaproteobacteria bacterium]|nr:PEP-CTERM sorting domain-containing protein [Gammaproteobacteria bacterium]